MSLDQLVALFGIVMASAWTPGPNNMMLAASGVNYGFRATLPHVLGVALGFGFMIFTVALGLGGVFKAVPVLETILHWGGAALLLWVAWKIANTKAPGESGARSKPFTFMQAAGFQWINAKAWVMCISISGQFLDAERPVYSAMVMAAVSMAGGITSASGWAAFGVYLQRWLTSPRHLRLFNYTMAAIIVVLVVWMLLH